jgi:hypothetical protein
MIGRRPDSMDLHQRGELGPAKRSASSALGEQWSFAAVVITVIMLPGRRCLFEGHPVLDDEVHERLRGVRHNAVRVFATQVIDPLEAQRPDPPVRVFGRQLVNIGNLVQASQ